MKILKNPKNAVIFIPIISIILGLLVGGIIMIIAGYNPIEAYYQLFMGIFGSKKGIGNWLVASTPIILTGISVAFAYRAGLFNIGAEGQFIVGSFAAIFVGIVFSLPAGIHAIVCVLAGMIVGAIWGFIPGILKAVYGVHEVVVTIMLNYIALYTTNALIGQFPKGTASKTPNIEPTASLIMPRLQEFFEGANINWGIIIAIIGIILFWFIINKMTLGFEIKAVGYNRYAGIYAGIKEKVIIVYTMMIAGAFAGIAGAIYSVGMSTSLSTATSFRMFGFEGITVALLGMVTPIGVLLSGLLLGGLNSGGTSMVGVPSEIIDIISATILIFVAMSYVIHKKLYGNKGGK